MDAGRLTQGKLDVTVGPLVNLWGFGPDKRPVKRPTAEQIAKARERVGIDKLSLTPQEDHFLLGKAIPDLYLDLSTLGEGAASDDIAALLERKGVHNYLVEVAGAVRSKGHNDKGNPWRVAIVEPSDRPGAIEDVVTPNGMALSTAGSYRNYYELDGRRYSHIIDPATGEPVTHKLVSASVITPTALEADALDTALMVMGPEQAMAFATEHKLAVYLIEKTATGFAARHTPEFAPYLVRSQP
ncbi:Thiamine biosynthesis lipoprotein ApbE precursor [compost metagenome]